MHITCIHAYAGGRDELGELRHAGRPEQEHAGAGQSCCLFLSDYMQIYDHIFMYVCIYIYIYVCIW